VSAPAVVLAAVQEAALREQVLGLAPRPGQEGWSGVPVDTLPDAERRGALPVAIVAGGEAVGFFVLDARGVPGGERHRGAVGLRSLFVDARHQRRGIGGAALRVLPAFAREHFPGAHAVVLTVNASNPVARHAYLAAGFHETGERYHGGRLGPQHVLVLDLAE
jgi:RimJ/RimL family protein N-acetyltransferase